MKTEQFLYVDVSEHSVCSIFIGGYPHMKIEQTVSKRRHIKFIRRGITQKKTYNIQNTAKVWNQEQIKLISTQSILLFVFMKQFPLFLQKSPACFGQC